MHFPLRSGSEKGMSNFHFYRNTVHLVMVLGHLVMFFHPLKARHVACLLFYVGRLFSSPCTGLHCTSLSCLLRAVCHPFSLALMSSIGHGSFNFMCLMVVVKLPHLFGTSLSLFDTQGFFSNFIHILLVFDSNICFYLFFQPASVLIFH